MKINIQTIVIATAVGIASIGYAGTMDKERLEAAQVDTGQETQRSELKAATERCYAFYGYERQHCLVEVRIRYGMN
jgi:hypothetical protein